MAILHLVLLKCKSGRPDISSACPVSHHLNYSNRLVRTRMPGGVERAGQLLAAVCRCRFNRVMHVAAARAVPVFHKNNKFKEILDLFMLIKYHDLNKKTFIFI
ncbi:hypothetical protein [Janthinobacterium sp. PC23-8]|uniref:hypothetical protein n=1 Tax=Janthinobacterium sp. PC23-8 TaxID=2012679 RepID=UPI0015952D25|nr:hypothetical protein [Janthinobacterium sp. PC23-8]